MLYRLFTEASGLGRGETDSNKFIIELVVGIPLVYIGFKLLF